MKYSRGDLPPKQFLAVHRDASELLDLLNENLVTGEYLVSVADWPAVRKRSSQRQYSILKILMLVTLLMVVTGLALVMKSPLAALVSSMLFVAVFSVIAGGLLLRRMRESKSREGRSVVVVTDRRLMRIWLDGTDEVQSFALGEEKKTNFESEPVPETVRLLLRTELGKTSLN